VPRFVNYKKGCTRLTAASDKVYQLLANGWWFSPASSTTKTGRHEMAEILLKVALNTKNKKKNQPHEIVENKMVSIRLRTIEYDNCEVECTLFVIYKAGREPTQYW
jgi:hypothetical protein